MAKVAEGTDPVISRPGSWPRTLARSLSPVLLAFASHASAQPDGIPGLLPGATAGDPQRGRAIVADRHTGLCLLCHAAPIPEERFQGDLAPNLAGAGARWTIPQLRLRIADSARLNPATIMPSYYRTEGLARVAPGYAGKTILGAQQIEDVVAYLSTLKDAP
jgi:sulfur-oxidizing protein SoxX